MNVTQGLPVGYQSIDGLHDSTGCKAARLENESKCDIEIWSEIWRCECKFEYNDYLVETIEPQKHSGVTKGRKSGGFIVYKIVKKSNNFVWIELSKSLIKNGSENVFIVAAYMNDIKADKCWTSVQCRGTNSAPFY